VVRLSAPAFPETFTNARLVRRSFPVPKAGLFTPGSWCTEIHPDLLQQPGDVQVVKYRISAFYSTAPMAQLRALIIGRIHCSGVSTQAVVQAHGA
jgi:nicotinamidase-related amidase